MTTIDEIAPDVFSICTYVEQSDLQFRQFLICDEQPLLYHTGPRRMFEGVRDAVGEVIDPASVRWIAFSHFEADECGALNLWLQEAPAKADGMRRPASHRGTVRSPRRAGLCGPKQGG